MAKDLKVNPNTIARVYKELEMEKITFTKRGMGTFITEDINIVKDIKKSMAQSLMKNFLGGMTDLGFEKDEIIEMIKNLQEVIMLLKTVNLKKGFFKNKVLNDFHLEIEKGYIYGLIGPNGSGKSTFMKIIADLVKKTM